MRIKVREGGIEGGVGRETNRVRERLRDLVRLDILEVSRYTRVSDLVHPPKKNIRSLSLSLSKDIDNIKDENHLE